MAVMRDYTCNKCSFPFESLLSVPVCKRCGTNDVKKELSAPAGSGNCAHRMLYPSRGKGK